LFKRLSHANLKKGKNFFFSSCRLLCKNAEMKWEKNRNRDRIFPELDGDNKVKNLDKTKIDEEKFSLTELGRIKTILKPWRSLISTRSFFGPGGQEFWLSIMRISIIIVECVVNIHVFYGYGE